MSTESPASIVVLFDVDNTLLDNDHVERDIKAHLEQAYGADVRDGYWAVLDSLRAELSYVDYLGALQRYRRDHLHDQRLLNFSSFLLNYPFEDRVYPRAAKAVSHLAGVGQTVILSDGDAVFQPHKIHRAGLWNAVGGRVLIYIHKEQMLADIVERYPARHYVVVDDKPRLLAAIKDAWGDRVTTVFPRQGHYAMDAEAVASVRTPDITIERVGDLADYDLAAFGGVSARV